MEYHVRVLMYSPGWTSSLARHVIRVM